jgi:hypothetical protein
MNQSDPWDHLHTNVSDDDPLVDAVRRDLDTPAAPTGIQAPVRVVCWPRLTLEQTDHALRVLSGWVEWLVSRYSLDHRTIPPCWHQHGALVEELSALRTLWQACYNSDASLADPANFHQHLNLALMRLRDWATRRDCKPGHHRDDQPPVWQDLDATHTCVEDAQTR